MEYEFTDSTSAYEFFLAKFSDLDYDPYYDMEDYG